MIGLPMIGRLVSRRFRWHVGLSLALFAFFLATTQFEHHDIVCHLKNPQHCTACASSQLGSDPHAPVSLSDIVLVDAGGAAPVARLLIGSLLPARLSGRSPPVAS
jgi:hypothetical protein